MSFKDLGVKPAEFVNAVREMVPDNYKEALPIAEKGQTEFKDLASALKEDSNLGSIWHTNALKMVMKILQRDNKIINPLSEFEGELIEDGAYVEEMIIDAAETFQFDPTAAEKRLFERRKPDLKAIIHKEKRDVSNMKTFQDTQVTEYFQNATKDAAALNRYIVQLAESMIAGNEQEKYYTTKHLISSAVKDNKVRVIDLGSGITAKALQKAILRHSKKMLHPSRYYNMGNVGQPDSKGRTGLNMQADKQQLRMLLPVDTSVDLNVDFFASAFHSDAVKSGLAIKEVDSFPSIYEYNTDHTVTVEDLANGFFHDMNYRVGDVVKKGTEAKEEAYEYALENGLTDIDLVFDASRIQAVILDRRALVINPMMPVTFANQANSLGRYVQIILQDKGLYSYSPFMPAVVIMSDTPVDQTENTKYITDVRVDDQSVVNANGVAQISYSDETAKAVAEVFGDGMTPDKFVQIALNVMQNNDSGSKQEDESSAPPEEEKEKKPSKKTSKKKKTDDDAA